MASRNSKATTLANAKLRSSGLVCSIKDLGYEVLEPNATAALSKGFKALAAIKLVYYDANGKPRKDGFFRIRYLEEETGFEAQAQTKPLRYTQKFDGGVGAHFSRLQDWTELLEDPDQPLILTEGEFKADAACQAGFPTVGLGGVYNWRSAKQGITLLPELKAINWAQRYVYLCFDSDTKSNPMVAQALGALATALTNEGARPHTVELVDVTGNGKTGLDDYLIAKGPTAFRELLVEATPWAVAKDLWEFNDEVVYVRDPGLIVVQKDGRKLSSQAFKDPAYANRHTKVRHVVMKKDEPVITYKPAPLPKTWLEWPQRYEAARLVYSPGKPRRYDDVYNTWPGWPVEPKKGDVRLWTKLLDHLFSSRPDPGARKWFEQWCAYPIQYPGTKMFSAALLWGRLHGTGKSLVGVTLGKVYGDNYTLINQSHLISGQNDWAENKQFVLADDITGIGPDRRHIADVLKTMITQGQMWINIKYVPRFSVRDVINYLITSNHNDALLLEKFDRRNFVWEVPELRLDQDFVEDYDLWMNSGRCAPALMDHLLNVDTSDFNPSGDAYFTQAKADMTETSMSDVAMWLAQVKLTEGESLRLGAAKIRHDLMTAAQVKALCDPHDKMSINVVGRELKRGGFKLANGGLPVRTVSHGVQRFYIMRNEQLWLKATPKQICAHLENPVKK